MSMFSRKPPRLPILVIECDRAISTEQAEAMKQRAERVTGLRTLVLAGGVKAKIIDEVGSVSLLEPQAVSYSVSW